MMSMQEQFGFIMDLPRVDFCGEGLHYIPRVQYSHEHPRCYYNAIYKDGQRNMPVLIWVHGGAFTDEFNTFDFRPERTIADLAHAGFYVVCIEYRLKQHALFPACVIDCQQCILYLREHADELNINPDKIGVWGESAGAYIADMCACNFNDTEGADIQAAVSFYAPSDLELQTKFESSGFTEDFLGIERGSQSALLREASPVTYATKKNPPILFLHGDVDSLVSYEQSVNYYEKLVEAGNEARLITVTGQGHGFFEGQEYYDEVFAFLKEKLLET